MSNDCFSENVFLITKECRTDPRTFGIMDSAMEKYCVLHPNDDECTCIREKNILNSSYPQLQYALVDPVCYNKKCRDIAYKTKDQLNAVCPKTINMCANQITIDGTVVGLDIDQDCVIQNSEKKEKEKVSYNEIVTLEDKSETKWTDGEILAFISISIIIIFTVVISIFGILFFLRYRRTGRYLKTE